VLIQGWMLIKFSPFSASVVCLLCNKTINGNDKKQSKVSVKHSEENSVFGEVSYSYLFIFWGWEGEGGWVLVVGAYLSLSGMGRGWALI